MANLAEMTESLRKVLAAQHAGDISLKIDMGPDGVIRTQGAEVSNVDSPADCTLTISKPDLERVMSGDLDPQAAMATGRLRLAGDMQVAVRMQPIIAKAWG